MAGRVRPYSEGLPQVVGPMKATLPLTSILRGSAHGSPVNCNFLQALTPPLRHISPEHPLMGRRSPGIGYIKGKCSTDYNIRRTASLDALYTRPTFSVGLVSIILHLDKATQTEESLFDQSKACQDIVKEEETPSSSPDIKIEKVIRQRWQRAQRGEHSVSSQTLSPIHGRGSPVLLSQRTNSPLRPMRSSVEGLNQEIEKLVMFTNQPHGSRNELGLVNFSRGSLEGHRAPIIDIFHDMRSVNTQTPIGDMTSSDESQCTSPEDGATARNASPRINKFLAREPPDGCERVCLRITEVDQGSTTLFKPCVGFQLRPSLGSAFQPLQPVPLTYTTELAESEESEQQTELQEPENE